MTTTTTTHPAVAEADYQLRARIQRIREFEGMGDWKMLTESLSAYRAFRRRYDAERAAGQEPGA